MNRKIPTLFLILILTIFIVNSYQTKITQEVIDELENNNDVRVIVELKEPSLEKGIIFVIKKTSDEIKSEKEQAKQEIINQVSNEKIKHVFDKSIALEISEKKIKQLEKNSNIKSIKIDKPFFAFLQDSVPLINASTTWPIQLSSFNITGINETVCIIDTGVDSSHTDLQNQVVGEYCFCSATEGVYPNCCPDTTNEDNNATDNNGHGTHVAGIVAAFGEINGVAIGAKIAMVKVLNSTGSGYSSDTAAAIEWCTNNVELYNISVISLSLGGGQYNDYCDGEDATTTNIINTAVGKNISVIVATGNIDAAYPNKLAGIASPACIKNSTRISATDKLDSPAFYAFRNKNFTDIFFAPGTSINSTSTIALDGCDLYGDYMSCSGTSMSAPHVAGAFAIIRQFFRLQNNKIPTSSEIKILLNNTGKLIDDSSGSGLNFTRIDVYSALLSIDSSPPTVNLISPEDNEFNFTQNLTFKCSANDILLSNITLYVWNSTSIYNTTLRDVAGTNAEAEFNLTNIPEDEYQWNCLAYDHNNNFSFASSNYTLTLKKINTILNSPTNNTFTNQETQTFNCSAQTISTKELTNITFFIWNSTELIYNTTQNISGTQNSTTFQHNLTSPIEYHWNCLTYNNESNFTFATNNNTLTYDITKPNVTSVPNFPTNETSNSATKSFYYNATDNYGINNCSLIVDNVVSLTDSLINISLTQNFTKIFLPGTYNWQINCTDLANNIENSSTQSFIITAPAVVTSSEGRGSGSSSVKTFVASPEQTSTGYTKELAKNDKIKFTIPNELSEQHTITTNYVGIDYADITIQSNPINFVLYIGEEKKLNLTSSEYYNLYIKLNSIKN
ncbi:MAG: S8 family serine peptidase [Nanoarchaeota archaeon]